MTKSKKAGAPTGPMPGPSFGVPSGSLPGEPWHHSSPPPAPDIEDLLRAAQAYPVAATVPPSMPWYAIGGATLGALCGGLVGHLAETDPRALVDLGAQIKPALSILNPPTERADVLHLLSEMMDRKGPHQEAAKVLHALISSGAHSGLAEKAHRRQAREVRRRTRKDREVRPRQAKKKPIVTPPPGGIQ